MNAPARVEAGASRPLAILRLRAWARARLWQAGELDLHEAVDTLQAAAVRDGLVAKLGQDRVQEIMAAAFAAVRDDLPKFEDIEAEPTFADDAWPAPGWREAALEYHKYRGDRVSIVPYAPENLARLRRLMDDNVSLDRAWHELNDRNRPTPKATIDAVWWAICEHGMSALAEPRIADRIANFDEAARSELDRRIANIGVKK